MATALAHLVLRIAAVIVVGYALYLGLQVLTTLAGSPITGLLSIF